jgi:hypothetical protein
MKVSCEIAGNNKNTTFLVLVLAVLLLTDITINYSLHLSIVLPSSSSSDGTADVLIGGDRATKASSSSQPPPAAAAAAKKTTTSTTESQATATRQKKVNIYAEDVAKLPNAKQFEHCDPLPIPKGRNVWVTENNTMITVDQDKGFICGPKILIVGKMKCGTNTVGDLVLKHPRVTMNYCNKTGWKHSRDEYPNCDAHHFQGAFSESGPGGHVWEGNYFNRKVKDDGFMRPYHLRLFASRLPRTDGKETVAISKGPGHFDVHEYPHIPKLAYDLLPNAKVIVT